MIHRTSERIKSTGEVFTPLELVDEILDKLPQEMFTDPKKTFLDPAAGDGNFLVRVLQRKIDNGSTPTQALKTTYGVDIMDDNIRYCKQRLLEIAGDTKAHRKIVDHNIVCADSLTEWDFETWNPKMKTYDPVLLFDPTRIRQRYVWNHPNGWNAQFDYSQELELLVISIIPDAELISYTVGNDGRFDVIIKLYGRLLKIEIKTIGRTQKKAGMGIPIEFSRSGETSGLTLSEADYYIIISTEYNNAVHVGKIRLIPRIVLARHAHNADLLDAFVEYPADDHGPAAEAFYLDPYSDEHKRFGWHVWLGDFKINEDGTWDLSKLLKHNPHIESNLTNIEKRIR